MQRKVIDKNVFLGSNPGWLSQRLLAIRLRLSLPIIEGPISLVDLKDERIRRAVSAYYHMIMKQEMPTEVVHFGVQHVSNYSVLHLAATQKRDDFEVLFSYGYAKDDVTIKGFLGVSDYCDQYIIKEQARIAVVIPNHECNSIENTMSIWKEDLCPSVVTFPIPSQVRPSTLLLDRIESPFPCRLEAVISVNGSDKIGSMVSLAVPGIDAVIDMKRYEFYNVSAIGKAIESNGIEIVSGNDGPLPELIPCVIKKNMWSVVVRYFVVSESCWKYKIPDFFSANTRKATKYRVHCGKLEKQIRSFFSLLVEQLKLLEQTVLIRHNITALMDYRFPMSMPGARLVNQSLLLVGRKSECSSWYIFFDEDWSLKVAETDWSGFVHAYIMQKRPKYKSIPEIMVEDFMLQNVPEISPFLSGVIEKWDDSRAYRGKDYMSYSQYIHFKKTGEQYCTIFREDKSRMGNAIDLALLSIEVPTNRVYGDDYIISDET